jgi:hypothetical protein
MFRIRQSVIGARVARVAGTPSRRVHEAREVGFRGGRIAPHRAMIGIEVSWTLLVDMLVLPGIFSVTMLLLLNPLMVAWRAYFEAVRLPLGLPGYVATRIFEVGPLAVAIPFFTAPSSWPGSTDLTTGWLITVLLLTVGMFLRGRLLPLGYLLRVLAIVQTVAQLWFTFMPPPFAYDLPTYMNGQLVYGVVVLVLAPFLVAFTFNIFDFRLSQKLLMGLLLLGHLSVLIPLLASLHAFIIFNASLLAIPMLFFAFGVLFILFVYVALYGWGMSWRSGGVLDATDRRPPAPEPRYPVTRARPTPAPQSLRAITPVSSQVVKAVSAGSDLLRRLALRDWGRE